MVPHWLQYLYFSFCNPQLRDFVDMGLGIEARRSRCADQWNSHLEHSKQFISSALSRLSDGQRVAVLGAGRLYDVPKELISGRWRVDFFDADPSAASYVRRAYPKVSYQVRELSGVLEDWTERLTQLVRTRDTGEGKLIDFFSTLSVPTAALSLLRGYHLVVSLNLLSQIPLFWRDRVHNLLRCRLKLDTDDEGLYSFALQQAFDRTLQLLQQQHMQQLVESGAGLVAVISDAYFCYQCDGAERKKFPALYLDIAEPLSGMTLLAEGGWLWEVAPAAREGTDYDQIHEVIARLWSASR